MFLPLFISNEHFQHFYQSFHLLIKSCLSVLDLQIFFVKKDYHIFRLRSLPRDVFHATIVDTVNLSFNEFVAMPTSALTEVAASLRSLDLSFNAIEH